MSDTINKDNINNNLNDEHTDKPAEQINASEPDMVNSENFIPETADNSADISSDNSGNSIPPDVTLNAPENSAVIENETAPLPDEQLTENKTEQETEEVTTEQNTDDKHTEPDTETKSDEHEEMPDSNETTDESTEVTAEETTAEESSEDVLTKEEVEAANAKDSNYQITLVDERILRVRTTTNQSVAIDCNLIIKEEVQSNRIFIHSKPEEEKQEIEVYVKIGDDEVLAGTNSVLMDGTDIAEPEPLPAKKNAESNYQVSLINENVLRIKISTSKSVSVDCSTLDKTSNEEGEEIQTNKIFIKPKQGIGKQDVTVFIKIGSEIHRDTEDAVITSAKKPEPFQQNKLTPNPLVADLISKFSKPKEDIKEVDIETLSPEERLELKIGRKNPWKKNKEFLARNLYRGFISANIIAIVAMVVFYAIASKKPKEDEVVDQRRLIVMQDLPENLNQQNQNVDDPNKPEPPKDDASTTGSNVTPPVVTPKKIKPPKVNLPVLDKNTKDTNDTAIGKELDSLRKKNITGNNGTGKDTGAVNTSLMPDSLLKTLSANEVGLVGKFPPGWKQIDARTINMKDDFLGILLVDTTVKKEETMTMNIELDAKGEKFNQFQFKKVFAEDSLRTVFSLEPKQEGKMTFYRFYVSNKTDNIFINAYVIQSSFEKYKPEIERVVKTVRIEKPEKK